MFYVPRYIYISGADLYYCKIILHIYEYVDFMFA